MWLQHTQTQKGSATILALLAVLILGLSTSIYAMSAKTGIKHGDELAAQYAAEAGITYALAHAKQHTDITTGQWTTKLPTNPIALDSNNVNSPTFTITLTLLSSDTTLKDVTGTLRCAYYKITSLGKAGNTTRSLDAYLTIPLPPTPISTFELMKDADYSGSKWNINTTDPNNPFASAPADQYYQVLFKDTIDAKQGFNLNYNVNLGKITPGHSGDTGYGIYYLATGNADNMTGYVLQYDPGLGNKILVKKVIASVKTPNRASDNEIKAGNADSFQSTISAYNNKYLDPNSLWTGSTLNATAVDPFKKGTDLMEISIEPVLKKLNDLKKNNGDNHMQYQNHQLTINAQPQKDKNGNILKDWWGNPIIVHTISMDGLEILKFIDRGNAGPVLTQGSTGLRVWEADARFFNNTNGQVGAIGSIKIRSWGTEKNN